MKTMIMNNKKPALVGLGVVALAIGVSYYLGWIGGGADSSPQPSGPPKAMVEIAQAESLVMAPHTVLPGTVVSLRDATVASEASGKVLSVALVGDIVEVGDSIAELDPQNAKQLVAQRKAELARLKSLLAYHTNFFDRVGEADNALGVSEIGIAELRSNRDTAAADVAKAKAALTSAETDLARTSIVAPFSGRVVSQSIQPGEFAQVGSPIVRLVDTTDLEVSARVPAALVQPIASGELLEISGMGKTIHAPMRALVPVGDSISRTMELRVSLKDSDLLVGSPVRVSLPSAPAKSVVALPRDAVILRTNSQYVFVVEEGKASKRDVTLGYAEGDLIEVMGDVSAQDTVIIRGGERLRDGQGVRWQDATASKPVEPKGSSVSSVSN